MRLDKSKRIQQNGKTGTPNQITRTTGGAVDTRYRYEPNVHDRRLRMILNLAKGGVQGAQYRTNAENLITRINEFGRPNGREDEEDRDEDGDDESGLAKRFVYRYDGVNRLTDVIAKADAHYDYDLADNLLSAKGRQLNFAASYNDVNQIVAANSANYQYDANGNLLDDGKRQYSWDAENRLLSVADKAVPGKLTRFRYDGLSRRLAIIDQASATATPVEKRYLWCDQTLCQERDALDNVTKHYYAQGETHGATTLFYAQNHLGSVMEVFNSQGKIEAANDYDAYGNTTSRNRTGVNSDFRYAGMYYHEPSKLYLTLYRAYDPSSTRWLSRDPIEEAGGINLYAYVNGNPINLIDSSGLAGSQSPIVIQTPAFRPSSGPSMSPESQRDFGRGNQFFKPPSNEPGIYPGFFTPTVIAFPPPGAYYCQYECSGNGKNECRVPQTLPSSTNIFNVPEDCSLQCYRHVISSY